ncbi:PREDICTED: lipase PAD4 [Prunus dulcis]|uniref:PREDICTED: lipase PAD4 n=1 Tax=Prunus dulcis TaxID=3755 RepID=A0A5E4ENJ4_PRUDU|nr:protein EDS1L-like [Prunus dulcis]VVA16982.1 PREDICTED: lipase PAD4 [Prunus dulcis]
MACGRLGEMLNLSEELIKKSCYLSLKAQNFPDELLLVEKPPASSHAFFCFPGSWSVDSWFSGEKAFGETVITPALFPCMKSIGNHNETAKPGDLEFAIAFVNQAFLQKFEHVLQTSQLVNQVQDAINERKSIIFTGHSTGGAIAALATIWFLQKYPKTNAATFFCVTFGSPLVGNHIISHALRRENWSQYFIHFVMRYDIVPRILLAPLSSIHQGLQKILPFFDLKSPYFRSQILGTSREAWHLYTNVMRDASALTTHVASQLMGSTNLVLQTVKHFIKLSPYKPFGTYVFCTGNGKLVVLKNPEAVLQTLFYSCQLSSEMEWAAIAHNCLNEHFSYEKEFLGGECSLDMQDVVALDKLEELCLGSDRYLDDLGLSAEARLCLRAAGESEKQKGENQKKVYGKREEMKKALENLEEYRALCEHNVGYFDAFKIQKDRRDFEANVSRIVLTGIWDEIIEMLKKYELPDEFEAIKEWIQLGTRFRRLVEPIDIANYYRHSKDEDTGPYMKKGRPKRYKYPQRWLEHEQKLPAGSCGESWFWAEVEELHKLTGDSTAMYRERERVLKLQREVGNWIREGLVGKDVLLKSSTFYSWWQPLPPPLKSELISGLMDDQGSMQE